MEEQNNNNIIPEGGAESKKNKVFFNKIMPRILGAIGLTLVISIIGMGAILAGHVWDPSWNPFKKQAPAKSLNVKTIEAKIFTK